MRFFWPLIVLLAVALPARCGTLYHVFEPVQMPNGEAISGASIYVYQPNGTTQVTIYSDPAGASPITQPDTTDATGMMSFYVEPGMYDVRVDYDQWNIDSTWENWTVGVARDTLELNALQFGSDTDTGALGSIYIPKSHSLWVRGRNSKARAGASFKYCMTFGNNELQMEPNTALSWVVPDSGSWSDHAFILPDTSAGSYLDVLKWQSTRTDSLDWRLGKVRSGPAKGGLPLYAGYFYTNMPDSAASGGVGVRTAFRIRWDNSHGRSTGINNAYSEILSLMDGATEVYQFRKNGLAMYPQTAGSSAKKLTWGGGTHYTQITESDDSYTQIKANTAHLKLTDESDADVARLDAYKTFSTIFRLAPCTGTTCRDTTGVRLGSIIRIVHSTNDTLLMLKTGRTWGQIYP
jgi:hypothetical protein